MVLWCTREVLRTEIGLLQPLPSAQISEFAPHKTLFKTSEESLLPLWITKKVSQLTKKLSCSQIFIIYIGFYKVMAITNPALPIPVERLSINSVAHNKTRSIHSQYIGKFEIGISSNSKSKGG